MDRLSKFGTSFQLKVLSALLSDKIFFQQISDIIFPAYFDSESNKWLLDEIIKYYREYNSLPNIDVLKIRANSIHDEIKKVGVIESLKEVYRHLIAPDLEFVKKEILDFCRNQCIRNAILDSVNLLAEGKYTDIKGLIENALKAGTPTNLGYSYLKDIEQRYSETARQVIPTPWKVINDLTGGGFAKGELVTILAPSGIGKSWALINFGIHALKLGYNVVHYTLELNESTIGLRYDACLSGISIGDLKDNIDVVKKKLSDIKGNLVIKYFPPKSMNVSGLKLHLERCILQNIKPDLVIIDYADLLKSDLKSSELRQQLESTYEYLRGMGGEYNIPIYTASQTNRQSLNDDIIGGDKISESYGKIMVSDFVMSLSRKPTDKIKGIGRFHIIKNRIGPDGLTFKSEIDLSNGKIVMLENSEEEKKVEKAMSENGEVKKYLSDKFDKFKKESNARTNTF